MLLGWWIFLGYKVGVVLSIFQALCEVKSVVGAVFVVVCCYVVIFIRLLCYVGKIQLDRK